MAHRVSGNRAVVTAVAGTIGAVCVGAIYVPFIADRDKLRGLHEESTPPTSAMLAQEIKKLQQEGILRKDDDDSHSKLTNTAKAPGSMWKNMSK
mmetsp:Transcript_21701/g.53824  ORF Transcript_21701/g.53824 Transcript_21701/m.53824 type:complete len:94 (-) Transcript_21701:319-600(-)